MLDLVSWLIGLAMLGLIAFAYAAGRLDPVPLGHGRTPSRSLSVPGVSTAPTPTAHLRECNLKGRKLANNWYITEKNLKDYFEQPQVKSQQEG